jgi:hypothetical protein
MDIIGLTLPDPQHLIGAGLNGSLTKCHGWELLPKVIAVHYTKLLNGVCQASVLPVRTDLLSLCGCAIIDDVAAHIDKEFICFTHCGSFYIYYKFLVAFPLPTLYK